MGTVVGVHLSPEHAFSKACQESIRLVAGLGVEGDAHAGAQVQHRYLADNPRTAGQPNLRQVHLVQAELHDELREAGRSVAPGDMGENITTRGVDLLGLPEGTRLTLGGAACVEVTGLRNPCPLLNDFQPGLMKACLGRDAEGKLVRKAGIMSIVLAEGDVRPGDGITVQLPDPPHRPLKPL